MPKKPQGLQQKGNAYYLRVRVPADLKKTLKKNERVISLDTSDYHLACKKIHGIRAELEKEWETLRHNIEAANQNKDMLSSYGVVFHDLSLKAIRICQHPFLSLPRYA